jgi:hypothetical protein
METEKVEWFENHEQLRTKALELALMFGSDKTAKELYEFILTGALNPITPVAPQKNTESVVRNRINAIELSVRAGSIHTVSAFLDFIQTGEFPKETN